MSPLCDVCTQGSCCWWQQWCWRNPAVKHSPATGHATQPTNHSQSAASLLNRSIMQIVSQSLTRGARPSRWVQSPQSHRAGLPKARADVEKSYRFKVLLLDIKRRHNTTIKLAQPSISAHGRPQPWRRSRGRQTLQRQMLIGRSTIETRLN